MADCEHDERQQIIAWLRAHHDQHERAIKAGACIRGSTTHGELRDEAAYFSDVADRLERFEDTAWRRYGVTGSSPWIAASKERETTGGPLP